MLTVASLLAAMTIAGAFWVGVLAARRLRDWGEGRRALEESDQTPLQLAAASAGSVEDERSRRVRGLVAQRLQAELRQREPTVPRQLGGGSGTKSELGLSTLRAEDVVVVDSAEPDVDGDYIVEGLVTLREGADSTTVAVMADGSKRRWLVGKAEDERWLIVDPVVGHELSGEPPRHIQRGPTRYGLERRGQASAASVGNHGRPDKTRAATYLYRASQTHVLWVERWGTDVLMGEGLSIPSHTVSFLPGS